MITAIRSVFLLYAYAIMSNDTGKSSSLTLETNTTTALINATERSFAIILPLSTIR
jgi:hypothetical protein